MSPLHKHKIHPKTPIEICLNTWTRVSVNSENCMVFQWTVRVSQRLQSRLLQSGAFQRFGLVQIVLETSKIRGVSQTLGRQTLYMTGALAVCFDDYGDRAVQSNASTTPYTKFRTRPVLYTQEIPALRSTAQTLYKGR